MHHVGSGGRGTGPLRRGPGGRARAGRQVRCLGCALGLGGEAADREPPPQPLEGGGTRAPARGGAAPPGPAQPPTGCSGWSPSAISPTISPRMSSIGTSPLWGTFDTTITLPTTVPNGPVLPELRVYSVSMRDGSEIGIVAIPLSIR